MLWWGMVVRLELDLMDDVFFCKGLWYVEWYSLSDRSVLCVAFYLLFFTRVFHTRALAFVIWWPMSTVTGLDCFCFCLDYFIFGWDVCYVICLDYFNARLTAVLHTVDLLLSQNYFYFKISNFYCYSVSEVLM